jgi:hypothetical protein
MRKIISILATLILVATETIATAQVPHPVPQTIQNLTDSDYALWARWQNRQAVRRAGEEAKRTRWDKYDYTSRVVSNSFSRGSVGARNSSTSRSSSNLSTRRGSSSANFNRSGGTTITSHKMRYLNPEYVGPSASVFYNPWIRYGNGKGTPDWKTIFVPCREGTITMQEVLDQLVGPQNPEKVFGIMIGGYFDG